ncbi:MULTISPECIES: Zn-ribbon domain-containing OB-fold protein [Actinomadura]|uniref:Zn-ribbon domain-containing OB-fold protein n=1 Tax=Actinomadura yumaensis TaxID=111807 RepID=A0ABW2CEB6_9ACTN|nr:hypothetical protein [Actinomadura sp. J1-007]MWK38366.1 hypothetical protein [Actinomadura sp. J1-007]
MTYEVPTDEVTAPWWDATREKRMTVQRRLEWGHRQHCPRALCTGCGGAELDSAEVSGTGTVDSCTVVRRPTAATCPSSPRSERSNSHSTTSNGC